MQQQVLPLPAVRQQQTTKPVVSGVSGLRVLAWEWAPLCLAVCFVLTFLAFTFSVPSQELPSVAVELQEAFPDLEVPADPPRSSWAADQRVAWVVPFMSAPTMPPYVAFCLRSIATSSPYLHVYIAYENATMILPDVHADNIHYVSFKELEVADRLLAVLKTGLSESVVTERAYESVRDMFHRNPRKVGAYKPLFGAAFHDIIGNCSHWAWGDVDTLLGDVPRLVSGQDLRDFDIISFNGGTGLLYLQGQLTILANRPEVNTAWKSAPQAGSLASANPTFAWEETSFSTWALYSSTLRIKLMPLQFSGKYGVNWRKSDGRALIWDNGRLLLHSLAEPVPLSLVDRLEAPLLYQSTWTRTPQRPGPYVLERLGSAQKSVWYGSLREAPGYDRRTEEYVLFHYNYEHEERIPNALAEKSPEEVRAVLNASRIAWNYSPFDFNTAPPCGTPGGGNCPLS